MEHLTDLTSTVVERYRLEHGSVYEYSKECNAYLFIGKLNGDTLEQFIKDYEYLAGEGL